MEIPIFTVDSFSDKPFAGNPAGVCLIPHGLHCGDELLQKIAAEMNLSETGYVQHETDCSDFSKNDTFQLRWFTPTNEVNLCGHGTLAAAAVLFMCSSHIWAGQSYRNRLDGIISEFLGLNWKRLTAFPLESAVKENGNPVITFHSQSGPLLARRAGNAITLDFPLNPVQPYDKQLALPTIKEICDPSMVSDVQYSKATKKLVVRLKDGLTREYLESLSPDIISLHASDCTDNVRGVIVTVRAESGPNNYDFLSRYFAPWNGIPEDPVTGSAHTVLADYWNKQLGKSTFKARQCSKRGGDVIVNIVGERVELTGNATVVLRGNIAVR